MQRVRPGYWIALLAVALAGVGLVAVDQVQAARDRAQGQKEAAQAAAADRQESALVARSAQILAMLPAPRSLTRQAGFTILCQPNSTTLCYTSSAQPWRAIVPGVAAMATVLKVGLVSCQLPGNLARRFGRPGTPCFAHAATISDRDGSIFLAVSALPIPDRARSRPGHLVFSGSSVEIGADWATAASG